MDKSGNRLRFLHNRYAVVYKYKGYAICTLKVAVPAEGDELGYVIDDAKFEVLVFGEPEGAIQAINEGGL